MEVNINEDNVQPILAVGIDPEKSTFNNMIFKVEEIEEGIISYYTIKHIEYLLKDAIPLISEEKYNDLVKQSKPVLYLIYDIEDVSVYLSCCEEIQKVTDYNKREKEILKSARSDFSIR